MTLYEIKGLVSRTPDGYVYEQHATLDHTPKSYVALSDELSNESENIPNYPFSNTIATNDNVVNMADYYVSVDSSHTITGYVVVRENEDTFLYYGTLVETIRDCIHQKFPVYRIHYQFTVSDNENEHRLNVTGHVATDFFNAEEICNIENPMC